ncbi:hypothetical protein GDO81_025386 [Engystomops pustulosus]|uniref:Uncharacterized protein n=1 Tax=Engystomops pustulosus TaxID=76066 RepID=A0AAV6ZNH7_ENGPU|nr:hypothetical protein GDO81_025386 [Engystomops pustulosus]
MELADHSRVLRNSQTLPRFAHFSAEKLLDVSLPGLLWSLGVKSYRMKDTPPPPPETSAEYMAWPPILSLLQNTSEYLLLVPHPHPKTHTPPLHKCGT